MSEYLVKSSKKLLGALPKDLFSTSGVIDWLDNSSEASNIYVTYTNPELCIKSRAMYKIGHNKDGS